jgi:GNAT superfamily N-acetyltransferase
MKIRKFKPADTVAAAQIIRDTYGTFNKNEGTKDAVQGYIDFWDPEKQLDEIKKRFSKKGIFLIAEEDGKVVGVARGRKEKLTTLFVKGALHNRGIGRKLMERYEKAAAATGSCEIKINASIYAVPFYEKLGYKKTTGIRNKWGLKVQPMKKNLN